VVEGEGEAEEEEEDDEGVGPDLLRMDQAGCQCRQSLKGGTDLGWCFRLYTGKFEDLVISDSSD
jgi:hypothetical protein